MPRRSAHWVHSVTVPPGEHGGKQVGERSGEG